jgi:hypothetical protein
MFFNILLSFIGYTSLNFFFKNTKYEKISNSINILINSSLIVSSTTLYLSDVISDTFQINILYLSIGFYINDLLNTYYNRKQLIIKSIHHFIGLMGILTFNSHTIEICKLFQTEISNLPFEIRNIIYKRNLKYPNINTICIFIFYGLFFYMRIFKGYGLVSDVCSKEIPSDCFLVTSIYVLWWYWFVLINYKLVVRLYDLYIGLLF